MKKISILGSTGSIGTQSLDIIENNLDKFKVSMVSCGHNIELLERQIEKFKPEIAVVGTEEQACLIQKKHPKLQVSYGMEGLIQGATCDCDMVLNSLMGIMGLVPTYHAIKAGKDIALANKETLVAGGELVMNEVDKQGVKLLPVDSEHSAIFQCLMGNENKKINRILLTASGGPFRGYSLEQLEGVTLEQALKHPNWSMGRKITIDSATLMNKGLEVIEAKWLFNVDLDRIDVHVHPQSIVHSMVEFEDTSVIAQMGLPDMRIPISLAFAYPERLPYYGKSLNFFEEGNNLTFEKPNPQVFKCLDLAYQASKAGDSYPVALNGANEVLVDLFLNKKIKFIDIQRYLERVINEHAPTYNLDLEGILSVDKAVREYTRALVEGKE